MIDLFFKHKYNFKRQTQCAIKTCACVSRIGKCDCLYNTVVRIYNKKSLR